MRTVCLSAARWTFLDYPPCWTRVVSTSLHSVKFAVMKSKNQAVLVRRGLVVSDLPFPLPPRYLTSCHRDLGGIPWGKPLIPQQCIPAPSGSCFLSHPRPGRQWPQTSMGGQRERMCDWRPDPVLSWLSVFSHLLKGGELGKDAETRGLDLLESFSLSLVLLFLNQMCALGLWKLPVASPTRLFNAMMQVAPRLESGITLDTWPGPRFPDCPAGWGLPQGAPELEVPPEQESAPRLGLGRPQGPFWAHRPTLQGAVRLFRKWGWPKQKNPIKKMNVWHESVCVKLFVGVREGQGRERHWDVMNKEMGNKYSSHS